MDNARSLFPKMAMNKVYTAIHFGRDTTEVGQYLQSDGRVVSDFGDPRFTTIPGGVCLRASDGTVLGAIGTSGRHPRIDEITDLEVALAGAQALSF